MSPLNEIISDRRSNTPVTISFLVPAFNEKTTISPVLDSLEKFPEPHETIVIDDGSTDGTREVLRADRRAETLIVFHSANMGKGTAVRSGLTHARGRYVAVQDADLEYDPSEYLELLNLARSEGLSAVFGSRFLRDNPARYLRYWWGNKIMTLWINLLTRAGLTDSYTCFKLVDRDVLSGLELSSRGFEMEAEICVKLACRGIRIKELPIRYRPRRIEEGKKIKARDAFRGAITALRYRLQRRFIVNESLPDRQTRPTSPT